VRIINLFILLFCPVAFVFSYKTVILNDVTVKEDDLVEKQNNKPQITRVFLV